MRTEEERKILNLWDYGDPSATREKFETILKEEYPDDTSLLNRIIMTQIVRTHSLSGEFEDGHAILDGEFQDVDSFHSKIQVYYHLERGRLYNSNQKKDKAIIHFQAAWELANSNDLYYLAVDALHMLAIADTENAIDWNDKAIEYVEEHIDPEIKKWLGSLYNNQGWSYHDQGDYNKALELFIKARNFHRERGNTQSLRIAQWTIGRVYRSMKRYDEALKMMHTLEKEAKERGEEASGYTLEELGELYLLRKEPKKYHDYFHSAYLILSNDNWLVRNEPERLERMKKLSGQ